jgi:anti-sigma factor RsiW
MAVTECEEIQPWLSDYLEGTLESGRHRAVEDHLYLCPDCLAVADDLAESIKSVASLPSVDPPLGFTQRVMAQVREEAAIPSFWERIFQPFSVKIPIHATAVVLVGILAVYLFQKSEAPQRELSKSVPAESELALRQDFKESDAQPAPRAAAPMALSQKKAELADEVGAVGALSSRDRVLEEMRAAPMRTAEMAKKPAAQAGQYELALVPQTFAQGGKDLRQRVDDLVKKFHGQIIQPADAISKMKQDSPVQPKTLWITLPATEYQRFKTELASLGRVQESTVLPAEPTDPATGVKQLRIQLTIMPIARPK